MIVRPRAPTLAVVLAAALALAGPRALADEPATAAPTPAPAPATASPEAQAEAEKAMERGVEAAKRNDHAEALAQYRRASALVPQANLPHRYAADACLELGLYDDAITELESYLRIKPTVQDAPAVRARIEDIKKNHVEGVVDVECAPDGARVFVDDDGTPAGTTPLRSLRLRAGPHTLVVRAEGFRDGAWPTQVTPGTTRVVQCSLVSLATPAGGGTPARPSEPPPKRSIFTSWWFWTGVGVLAAGAGVTAIALSQKSSDPPRTDGGTLRFP